MARDARWKRKGVISMGVQVVRIRRVEKGSLKAFATVMIDRITIRGFRIVQQEWQRAWVSVPQVEYMKDGEKKYAPIVILPDALKREVDQAVLEAWRKNFEGNSQQ